ncbi:hypothetical protein CHH53_04760 [Terribacillus sp. 7520-G]|nr:hypothetical protein CHH53_04760 [Terribacillus sp. 7520-G]
MIYGCRAEYVQKKDRPPGPAACITRSITVILTLYQFNEEGYSMVKDSYAPREKKNGEGKKPDEQRRGKARSNTRGGRN